MSPLGVPTWSQNRVPLGLPVETFEDGKLDAPQRVERRRRPCPRRPHLDWFSPGSFVELSEAEAMALPAFERHQAGVVVTLAVTRSAPVTKARRRSRRSGCRAPGTFVDGLTIPGHVLDRMQAIDAPPSIRPRPARFGVGDDRFRVETGPGTVVAADVGAVAAHLAARAPAARVQHAADRLVEVTV